MGESKKGAKRRRRAVHTVGVTSIAVGSALMAAGGTAVALTDKRGRKLARKVRRRASGG
jgi:hypothetical protein